MEEKTLTEKIDAIFNNLEKSKKPEKKFKLPMSISIMKGKIRKNFVLVFFMYSNGNTNFKFVPIEDNSVKIGEYYYDANANYILRYKKWPLLVLPEWNIVPVHNTDGSTTNRIEPWKPQEDVNKATKEGTLTATEKFIILKAKLETIKSKMKINIGVVLIIIAVLIGGYYLLHYLKLI